MFATATRVCLAVQHVRGQVRRGRAEAAEPGRADQGIGIRIYLSTSSADTRNGFDSLAALVREGLGHDPLSGHLFLFVGRNQDRLKLLYWDSDGYALWYKRLEEGTFRLPPAARVGASVELKASELAMLLAGIDLTSIKRRKRFTRGSAAAPSAG